MAEVGGTGSQAPKSIHFKQNRLKASLIAAAIAGSIPIWQSAASAAPNTWIGASGGNWSDGTNWSAGNQPGSGDDAIDNSGATINLDTSDTINSLTTNGAFNIIDGSQLSGSQANAASPFEFDNSVTFNGGGLSNATISGGASGSVSIENNGSNFISGTIINANANVGAGFIQVYGANSLSGDATLAGGTVQLHDGNANLTLTSTGELNGQGTLNENFGGSTLTNDGLVSADVSGNTLVLANTNATGTGTFQAINGATLQISDLLTGANSIVHGDTGVVLVNGGGVSGTISQSTGSGLTFAANGSNYMSSATIDGNVTMASAGFVQVYNTNTITGTVDMVSTSNGIELHDGNAHLTLSSTALLQGVGTIYENFGNSTLENDGTISANVSGQPLAINNSNLIGSGILSASNGGILSIGAQLNGSGMQVNTDTTPGSTVEINGGGLSGLLGATTGTGLSFAANGNNNIGLVASATVNGTLTFPNAGFAQVYGSNTINGTIVMASTSNGIELHDGNAIMGLSSTGLLEGYGEVYENFGGSTVQNNGTINANVSSQTLAINNTNLTGTGVFEATGGGILSIGALLNGSQATVHGDTGTVQVNGGGVSGTFLASTGTGITFAANGNNYLSNATVLGNLTMASAGFVQVYNTNTVGGTFNISSTLNGIELHDGNALLTLNSTAVLQGFGDIYENFGGGTLQDNGAISANTAAQVLDINDSNLTGSGTLAASNGGTLSIGAAVTGSNMQVNVDNNPNSIVEINGGGFSGTLGATTGSGLSFSANGNNYMSSATINGTVSVNSGGFVQMYDLNTINGSILMADTANGIELHDGNATLQIGATGTLTGYGNVYQNFGGATVNNAGTILVPAVQTLAFSTSTFTTSGTIDIPATATLSINSQASQTGGITTVDGILISSQQFSLIGGTLTGKGTLDANLDQTGGTFNPGGDPGLFTINGSYNLLAPGTLNFDIGGYTPDVDFSVLDVTGPAALGGNLNLTFINGFLPQVGDTFTLLYSQADSGTFTGTTASDPEVTYVVNYGSNFAQVMITAVPEPASAALLAVCASALLSRRRRTA